jgi:hypothetical protein
MKIYRVTIDWEIEIKAENEQEAIELGLENWRDSCEEGIYFNAKELKN